MSGPLWYVSARILSMPAVVANVLIALQDLPAMIDFMKERFPTRRLVFIGHSVGGHIMPLPDNADKLSHCMTVGTQNAYYPLTPFRYRYGYLWSVLVPASTQMFGYYPGNKLGIIGAVPTTIMQSWRAWATHPLYVRGRHLETQEYATLSLSTQSMSFSSFLCP